MSNRNLYEFQGFRLDADERQLWRGSEEIRLTAKALDVLLLLVRNPGRTITKEEFMTTIWPDTVVEEANLTDNIFTLRQALGDDARDPRMIKTIPRRGYRFVATLPEASERPPSIESEPASITPVDLQEPRKLDRSRWWIVAAAIVVVLLAGIMLMTRERPSAAAARQSPEPVMRTLAVLPFRPLVQGSSDPALELGMTDSLISRLTRLSQITVRPTASILQYSKAEPDLRQIAKELSVDAILDGKVHRSGDRVRLSVQLVRVSDGRTIWADRFDESFTDIFSVQDAISERAAQALAIRISGTEQQLLKKRYTDDIKAYQLYLLGRQLWSTFEPPAVQTSVNFYRAALREDPEYALAYSGIADAYTLMSIWGPLSAREAGPKGAEAALTAVRLDPELSQAQTSLCAVNIMVTRDWEGAARACRRGMELDPENTDAATLFAYSLQANGKTKEAMSYLVRARDLAPSWHVPISDVRNGLYFDGQLDKAIIECNRALALDPTNLGTRVQLAQVQTAKGSYEQALTTLQLALPEVTAHRSWLLAHIAYIYARTGREAEARKLVGTISEIDHQYRPMSVALVYVGLRDHDKAFEWLDRALDEKYPFLYRIRFLPLFAPIRSDPRYVRIMQSMNLRVDPETTAR